MKLKTEVVESLKREFKVCTSAIEYYQKMRGEMEKKHGISSLKFMKKFEDGQMGDDQDFFDWYAYNRFVDSWQKTRMAIEELVVT